MFNVIKFTELYYCLSVDQFKEWSILKLGQSTVGTNGTAQCIAYEVTDLQDSLKTTQAKIL